MPSDCLAAMLAQRLPGAQKLELAFTALGGMSPGTTKTMIEALPSGGRARIDGVIRRVPTAWKTMEVPFRHGKLMAMSIPWGDVASAYYSTGIPNIEVYASAPPKQIARMRRIRFALPLLGIWPLKTLAMEWVERNVKGPSDEVRATARSSLWGRVTDASGKSVSATLETLSGYHLTALTAVAALQRSIARQVPRGFSTASQAFGREFILSFPDTDIQWTSLPTRVGKRSPILSNKPCSLTRMRQRNRRKYQNSHYIAPKRSGRESVSWVYNQTDKLNKYDSRSKTDAKRHIAKSFMVLGIRVD